MTETEELGHFEQGIWIPQPKLISSQLQQDMSFQYPTMQDNVWMIMVRLVKIESHLYRLEQLLNAIETDLRWRR